LEHTNTAPCDHGLRRLLRGSLRLLHGLFTLLLCHSFTALALYRLRVTRRLWGGSLPPLRLLCLARGSSRSLDGLLRGPLHPRKGLTQRADGR
jgi:hypothetical protein